MKRKYLTQTLILFCLSLLTTNVLAQSNNWNLLHEEKGVQIFGMDTYCSNDVETKPNHFAFLKIVNSNNENVKLNFGFALEFEEGCSGCDQDSEFFIAMDVPANSTLEGSCADQSGKLARMIRNANLPGGWSYQSMKITYPIID